MSNDARRDSEHKNERGDPGRRREEIDQRTRESADKLVAKEPQTASEAKPRKGPESLPRLSSSEHFQRLDRISERSSMRQRPEFDPAREQQLEDIEIRTSPVAFLRRQDHAGLDKGTIRLVEHSLGAHGIEGPDDLRATGVDDTWGIWNSKAKSKDQ
ncbi:MAG: hypothetical protein WC815_04050 [Vicinamibacterales bacterium]|jgi:hypothetical protein